MLEDDSLRHKVYQSDGLLKTPILIARSGNEEVMRPDDLKQVNKGINFYPYVDVKDCSDASMRTLYIDDHGISDRRLMKGLKKGLEQATKVADEKLQKLPAASSVSKWSDVAEYYERKDEDGLLREFKVSEISDLPDLSKMTDWSELDDKYLKSREIIRKYLR